MATPQDKFFDTDKKIFVEDSEYLRYVKDRHGDVFMIDIYLDSCRMMRAKNIIAVPFTGQYDKNQNPLYDGDIIKNNDGQIFEICFSIIEGIFRVKNTKGIFDTFLSYKGESYREIIGSSLANPELLENKQ